MSGAVHAFARQARLPKTVAPFPVPPHQTGHAVFPHPAFRRPSPTRSRRCHPSSRFDTVHSGSLPPHLGVGSLAAITGGGFPSAPGRSTAPSLLHGYVAVGSPVLRAAPTSAPHCPSLRRLAAPGPRPGLASQSSHCRGTGTLWVRPLLFPRWLSHHSTSHTPQGSSGLHSKRSTLSLAFALPLQARLPALPLRGG